MDTKKQAVMLTKFDDFPRHQTVETMAYVGTPALNWNDGYFFATWDPEGRAFFTSGLRVYQNADVMDRYMCLSGDGKQMNVRGSRRYSSDYDELRVVPFKYEIVEGLRLRRLQLDPEVVKNKWGVDILFEASGPPFLETRRTQRIGGVLSLDIQRSWQPCRASGWIRTPEKEFRLNQKDWFALMDHSWGLRPTFGPRTHTEDLPPVPYLPPGENGVLRPAVQLQMPEYCGFFHTHEDASGQPGWFDGRSDFRDGKSVDIVKCEHSFKYRAGCHTFERGTFVLTDSTGQRREYKVMPPAHDPIVPEASGYYGGFNDHRGPGVFRGDLVVEEDVWQLRDGKAVDPDGKSYPRSGFFGPAEVRSDDGKGSCYFEHVIFGTYRRYGFVADEPPPVTVFV